ncbi:3-hydroxyacyl-[acyl-carrier-protein] dehydratase [Streptomyces zhaozhouensis]|uniref:3-hydroxyacyl-[acyl-carrier-protein] dehydratase n=1 Tax=Streptomyces zhaozhouensis TaxID=1300267 RepID=A0A286DVD4_9ACTN|nr:beta-hydroxyacyl-ACP dehydratase [Streptomyces zhaozhouensis]SOD62590.1 3-hydroxyacyl-[acyl-carrier-protein] dehydratase [Streptomyces zhaozhouensis]
MSETPRAVGATQAQIRARLPHRFPMLLVDRVTEVVPGERLVARKAVTCNEPWYAALGPEHPESAFAYPQTLLVESWCQSAGVLATWESPNPDVLTGQVMLFGGMSGVVFHGPVLPGDVVEHEVLLSRSLGDTLIFEGVSTVAGEPVLTVERVVMALRPAEALRPADQDATAPDSAAPDSAAPNEPTAPAAASAQTGSSA